VRTALRFLTWVAIASALSVAALPAKPLPPPPVEKTDYCAVMKSKSAMPDCDHHKPKPAPDKQCCVFCASCVAGILAAATPFVYPPIGDETFAAYISSEQTRSQRPPVPPPRT
jgi:hypothetical protein